MLRFLTTLTLTFLATPGLADTDLPDQATGAVYVLATATAVLIPIGLRSLLFLVMLVRWE